MKSILILVAVIFLADSTHSYRSSCQVSFSNAIQDRPCGGHNGELVNPDPIGPQFIPEEDGDISPRDLCAAACFETKGCLSLAVRKAEPRYCRLFRKNLRDQQYIGQGPGDPPFPDPVEFYNIQCFDYTSRRCPKNLINNRGDFENLGSWKRYSIPASGGAHSESASPGHCSEKSAKLSPAFGQTAYLQQDFSLQVKKTYVFSVDYMWETANPNFVLEATVRRDNQFNGYIFGTRADNKTLAGKWQRANGTITVKKNKEFNNKYSIVLDAGYIGASKDRTIGRFDNACFQML